MAKQRDNQTTDHVLEKGENLPSSSLSWLSDQEDQMVPPFLWGWILKNVSFFNIYNAAQSYGFHRIYRRVLEANKRLVDDPKDRRIVQEHIKEAMRFPNRVMDIMDESHVIAFLKSYANELVNDVQSRAPPFMISAAKVVVGKTPLGKLASFVDDLSESRKKRKDKTP